jgi:RNA polymerase sigma-70 factor (ECF subfamily)
MDMPVDNQRKQWFEEQISEVLDDLYGAALRLAKNRADAEDLVGEAVAKAFKNLDALKDLKAFRGWIFRILSNCFISECRKRKTRSETSVDFADEESEEGDFWLFDKLHQPFLLWWGNPEQAFLNELLRDDLVSAIDELPHDFRVVLVMAELEGLSYQDIADTLEVPVGTVRSRLSRARSILQKTLWEHAQDQGIAGNTEQV